ncbi:MAG TPA: TolC family protein, partial [Flavobacteriales bacterium]|nr:TolC family protein [Flavobacteriales bacterium]
SFGQKQKLAKKQALPKLLLGMDYIAIDNDSPAVNAGQNAIMFKIGFSIPINRQKNKARLKEAVLQQQMVSYNIVEKTNRLKSILEEAFKNYDDAMNHINLYKTQINLSKRALQILKTAYENNARNFEEVLRMNQQLLDYTVQLQKSRSDKQIAIAFINYLMGK